MKTAKSEILSILMLDDNDSFLMRTVSEYHTLNGYKLQKWIIDR